jgi:hypothetical protein
MNKKLFHAATLSALLTLTSAAYGSAMDHGSMNHGATAGTPAAATAMPPAAKPAIKSQEIRKAVVNGYTLTYSLIDMKQMMESSSMSMSSDMGQMKSHRLMFRAVGPDGKSVATGKVGYLVVQPDKTQVKVMAMQMEGGFGADIDLIAKGDYKITCKIALADITLVDEFVYKVKKTASPEIAVVNTTCPITGGALSPDGVVERLTRDYKGQKIGFCCDGCPETWDKLTDAEKDAELAKAKKPAK